MCSRYSSDASQSLLGLVLVKASLELCYLGGCALGPKELELYWVIGSTIISVVMDGLHDASLEQCIVIIPLFAG